MLPRIDIIISLHPDIVHRSEPFGGTLFNFETKAFHFINEPSYQLIQLLDTHPSVEQFEFQVRNLYTAALSQLVAEVQVEDICTIFLDKLQRRELIQGDSQVDEDAFWGKKEVLQRRRRRRNQAYRSIAPLGLGTLRYFPPRCRS